MSTDAPPGDPGIDGLKAEIDELRAKLARLEAEQAARCAKRDAEDTKRGFVKRHGEFSIGDTVRYRGGDRTYRLEGIQIFGDHAEATLRSANKRRVSYHPLGLLERVEDASNG